MYNFISTFDELNKLYEEAQPDNLTEGKKIKRSQIDKSKFDLKQMKYAEMKPGMYMGDNISIEGERPDDTFELIKSVQRKGNEYVFNYGPLDNDAREDNETYWVLVPKTMQEDFDDEEIEVVEDEAPVEEIAAEEPVENEEPKQVIVECSKCGALVIKDEADVIVDEESDLVNVEEECQYCEEADGYKIIGTVAPYVNEEQEADEPVEDEIAEDEVVEEGLLDIETPATIAADILD